MLVKLNKVVVLWRWRTFLEYFLTFDPLQSPPYWNWVTSQFNMRCRWNCWKLKNERLYRFILFRSASVLIYKKHSKNTRNEKAYIYLAFIFFIVLLYHFSSNWCTWIHRKRARNFSIATSIATKNIC